MTPGGAPAAGSARMDGVDVVGLALTTALELPGASLDHPFGPDWDVVKVGGKVFLLATDLRGEPVVTLKCDPEDGLSLRQEHEEITAGYHMNKRHWLTVRGGPGVCPALLEELVEGSWALVVAGLPRDRRPLAVTAAAPPPP